MDPMIRAREYLLDYIDNMTYPGNPSFDQARERWFVPICCSTEVGHVVVGDIEIDGDGHIVFAPSRKDVVERVKIITASTS
jgi:hypothetical protein